MNDYYGVQGPWTYNGYSNVIQWNFRHSRMWWHGNSTKYDTLLILFWYHNNDYGKTDGLRWMILALTGGVISSPHHPEPYAHALDCEWLIRLPPLETISIEFLSFQIERAHNCRYDFVEVRRPRHLVTTTLWVAWKWLNNHLFVLY